MGDGDYLTNIAVFLCHLKESSWFFSLHVDQLSTCHPNSALVVCRFSSTSALAQYKACGTGTRVSILWFQNQD